MGRQNQIKKPYFDTEHSELKKLTPNKLFKIALGLIVVAALVFILFLPRTEFFKGSLVPVADIEGGETDVTTEGEIAGSIVVKYLHEHDPVQVQSGDEGVTVSEIGLIVGHEPLEVSALTFEVVGATSANFVNMALFAEDDLYENVNFNWLTETSLLVEMISNTLELNETEENSFTRIYLSADIVDVQPGLSASFHVVDVTATDIDDNQITNIGITNDLADPQPLPVQFI